MKNTILSLLLLTSSTPFVSYFAAGFPSENDTNHFVQGSITLVHPDGVQTIIHQNGQSKTIIHPNGKISTVFDSTPTHKIITHSNGNVTTLVKQGYLATMVNPDGSVSTIMENGDRSIITGGNGTQITILNSGSTKSITSSDGTMINLFMYKNNQNMKEPDAAELMLIISPEATKGANQTPSKKHTASVNISQNNPSESIVEFIIKSIGGFIKKLINAIF
ncbi:hypothetical protein [Flectobacillus rivi]|uniref:FecR protein domain-containing protein n=1 Tax=Flectobacillus rivi TaxID=2984209 RepID=A0ABT6YYQ7_9BACT|nr:hypothetical protein [Flectobacillus rivi]MDI9874009.1 hypothetical protein [Flectobacillus rivi]